MLGPSPALAARHNHQPHRTPSILHPQPERAQFIEYALLPVTTEEDTGEFVLHLPVLQENGELYSWRAKPVNCTLRIESSSRSNCERQIGAFQRHAWAGRTDPCARRC